MEILTGPSAIDFYLEKWYEQEVFVQLHHQGQFVTQFLMLLDDTELGHDYDNMPADDPNDDHDGWTDRQWDLYTNSLSLHGENLELTVGQYADQSITIPFSDPDTEAVIDGDSIEIRATPWVLYAQKVREPVKRSLTKEINKMLEQHRIIQNN